MIKNETLNKVSSISCIAVFIASIALIVVSLCTGITKAFSASDKNQFPEPAAALAVFILEIVFIIGIAVFQYLFIRKQNGKYLMIDIFCKVGAVIVCVFTMISVGLSVAGICVMVAGLFSVTGCYIILSIILLSWALVIGLKKFAIFVKKCIIGMFNIGYTGPPPISYFDKVIEVFLQIVLLPVSAFIEACAAYFFIGGHFLGGVIIEEVFYWDLKKEKIDSGVYYNVGESDKVVSSTITHDIKNEAGMKIG